jgi:N-acetylglucosaminyl-diphospho-decaprenol L-rhamnosyltransferase
MLYISTVSHNHFSLIKESGCIAELAKDSNIKILVRDNIGESDFYEWCKKRGIYYFSNTKSLGFGQNNNLNFSFLPPSDAHNNDYFLVLNPDVIVTRDVLNKLIRKMHELDIHLATINLFLDKEFSVPDNCVRNFPNFSDFVLRFLLGKNHSVIDKSKLDKVSEVDWAAGSFLMFSRHAFSKLNGFDQKFFMYCEDIDICARYFKKFGKKISIFPDLFGTHLAMHNNRKIFSKHFFWHLKSSIRYLLITKFKN